MIRLCESVNRRKTNYVLNILVFEDREKVIWNLATAEECLVGAAAASACRRGGCIAASGRPLHASLMGGCCACVLCDCDLCMLN